MTVFKITYCDPTTGETKEHVGEYKATENVTAYEWAEDHAYMLADKGWYNIVEQKGR